MSGVGTKAFCAGGDIKNLYENKMVRNDNQPNKDFFAREYLLDYSLT